MLYAEIEGEPIKIVPKKKTVSVTITDEDILKYFTDNPWVNINTFVEKQVLNAIQMKPVLPVQNTFVRTTGDKANAELFYKEYSHFITEQKNIVNVLKENARILENVHFENLENFLAKFGDLKQEYFDCEHCQRSFRNFKALSTHQRKCKKENETNIENTDTEITTVLQKTQND